MRVLNLLRLFLSSSLHLTPKLTRTYRCWVITLVIQSLSLSTSLVYLVCVMVSVLCFHRHCLIMTLLCEPDVESGTGCQVVCRVAFNCFLVNLSCLHSSLSFLTPMTEGKMVNPHLGITCMQCPDKAVNKCLIGNVTTSVIWQTCWHHLCSAIHSLSLKLIQGLVLFVLSVSCCC